MPTPPVTRVQDIAETHFGTVVRDPFRWLEDERSPEVQRWLDEQNAFARAHLEAMPERDALTRRFTELYYLDAIGIPHRRGQRYFFARQYKDKEKAVVMWRDGAEGEERVLLDPNTWSADNTVSLGTWAPSWDGKKVVFAEKPNAADEATLYVLDVDTGTRSAVDVITGAKYASPSWAPDSKSFVYEWLPTDPSIATSERPGFCEVRHHVLGQDPANDAVLHQRTGDPKTFIGGGLSRDGHWLFVSIQRGWNENDLFFKRVGVDTAWRVLIRGVDAKYSVEAWRDVFYVFTDEGAPNKRVFAVDPEHPERNQWQLLIDEDPHAARESLSIVGGHLAISSLKNAASQIEVFTLGGQKVRDIALPGLGTASNLVGLEDDDEAYFAFSSFVMPRQTFKTSVSTGVSTLWAKVEVPADLSPFEVRQVWFTSRDGTRVSMFIVCRKDLVLDGAHPTLLYGYGGFDVSLTSAFTSFIVPWLERGGVYAVANLRGGGEYGKAWHDAGKLAHKQNVFDDFAAAARYLIEQKYTQPSALAIRGGSNGGLLTGVAMVQHPELFGAVICAVPLLDMIRYPLYGSGKTWVPEYGDPTVEADFRFIEPYSPYHHLREGQRYPPLLMMSADHDDRVDPFHARKFVARVQQVEGANTRAWLRVEQHAGHGGADQVGKAIESSVDQFAFLLQTLKVAPLK